MEVEGTPHTLHKHKPTPSVCDKWPISNFHARVSDHTHGVLRIVLRLYIVHVPQENGIEIKVHYK